MKKTSFRTWLPWGLAFLVVCTMGIQIRLYPLTHNVSSDAYEEGTLLVLGRIKAMISTQIESQYPLMPPDKKNELANTRLNETLRKDNVNARKAFDAAGYQLSQQSKDHNHYLLASDGYYFLNLTENIIKRGDVSRNVKGSRYFNDLMLAPLGYWEPQTWHPYIGAFIYRIIHFFSPNTDIMSSVAWTPVVLVPFVIAAFFFACAAAGCSVVPTSTAGIYLVMASIYIKRSTYAWYDNDSYAVLFPSLVLGFLFMSLRHLNHFKKFLIYILLCSATIALYSMFWSGWAYLWAVTIIGCFGVMLKSFLTNDKRIHLLSAANISLFLTTTLCVAAIIGLPQIIETITAAWGELQKFTSPQLKNWPDLFISVGELKKGSLKDIIDLGGLLPFLIAAGTLLCSLYRWKRKNIVPSDKIIILTAFFAITTYLGLSAQRFVILSLIPCGLLFACGLENLQSFGKKLANSHKTNIFIRHAGKTLIPILIILSVAFPVIKGHKAIRSLLNPIFNSAWDRALTRLKKETPENSIINSWWTPGHFIKAIANRRVSFDGASIKGEQAYWLTKVYLARDERTALGILRMLNISSNSAAEYLQRMNIPLSSTIPLLLEITRLNQKEAEEKLLNVFPIETTQKILHFTHGIPPPSYLLIYNEIAENNPLLGFIGKWNFSRIESLNKNPSAIKKIPGKGSPDYISFLWSLVGGPFRQSPVLSLAAKTENKEIFSEGIMIDTANMSAEINSSTFGHGIPVSLVYLDKNKQEVVEKLLPESTLNYSVVYMADNESPKAILMDQILANSLIVKMYYFDGKGLKHFKLFDKEQDMTGRTKIFIYQINWPENL